MMKYHNDYDGLVSPDSLHKASDEARAKVFNKCGPEGIASYLVPNSLLGVDISTSCNIHDWTYFEAKNQLEHKVSDEIFLENMKQQVRNKTKDPILKTLRIGMAYLYFSAVRIYTFFTKNTPQSSDRNDFK